MVYIKRSVHEALDDFGQTGWNAMFISSNKDRNTEGARITLLSVWYLYQVEKKRTMESLILAQDER